MLIPFQSRATQQRLWGRHAATGVSNRETGRAGPAPAGLFGRGTHSQALTRYEKKIRARPPPPGPAPRRAGGFVRPAACERENRPPLHSCPRRVCLPCRGAGGSLTHRTRTQAGRPPATLLQDCSLGPINWQDGRWSPRRAALRCLVFHISRRAGPSGIDRAITSTNPHREWARGNCSPLGAESSPGTEIGTRSM